MQDSTSLKLSYRRPDHPFLPSGSPSPRAEISSSDQMRHRFVFRIANNSVSFRTYKPSFASLPMFCFAAR